MVAPLDLADVKGQITATDLAEQLETDIADDDGTNLPNLFEDTPKQKKTQLSGKILTREEATSVRDRVDGVEVKLEVPLD